MFNKFKKFLKKFFLINDTPHKVAAGAALGIFLGIVPGEGVGSTLVLSSLFKFNRLSATAGVLATNMWTTAVVLPIAGIVGAFIFHTDYKKLISDFETSYHLDGWKAIFDEFFLFKVALPIFVGFFIVAGAISIGFYFLLYFVLKKRKIEDLHHKIKL